MKIYAGTSGYSYKEWKGRFYPERISPKEMLRYYSGRLSTVEINNTFYRMPKESVLLSWAEQVPEDFIFAVKAPQVITHLKRLRDVEDETLYFFSTLTALGKRLGPVLFQFPGSFRADPAALSAFLDLIPNNRNCAFEFRSPTWLNSEILDMLRKSGCSLCTADSEKTEATQIMETAAWGYLRLRRPQYSESDLSEWLGRLLSRHWERAFVFFKHEEEAGGAELAMRFQELAGLKERGISA
jgi:uncharacterized protein YecE (DUF72 family)